MSRKHLSRLLAVLVMLSMTLPPSFAFADAPTDKAGGIAKPDFKLPEGKTPAAVAATVALRESLTADQSKAIEEIVARYSPALNELAAGLPKINTPEVKVNADKEAGRSEMGLAQAKDTFVALKQTIARTEAIQAEINKEVAGVLSADQYANYEAGVKPAYEKLSDASKIAKGAGTSATLSPTATDYDTTSAYYAALYAAYGRYYGYYGYIYGYYNYTGYSTSTTYGYYGYYYSYYGASYAYDAVIDTSVGYWELYVTGTNFDGYLDDAVTSTYYAQLYNYYGYYYSYLDYANTSRTYAYYAQYYAYYGYLYDYYAYVYAYDAYNT